jgi:hypothetical protein
MRKALGFVFLGCCLVVGLACTQGAGSPTQPAVSATSNVPSFATESTSGKYFICHYNVSDGTGVVVEITANNSKTHSKHIAADIDCYCDNSPDKSGAACDTYTSSGHTCYYSCPNP